MFHVFLTLNCLSYRLILLEIDESLQSVSLGEAFNQSIPMFRDTADKVARHANIERSVRSIGEDVNLSTQHTLRFAIVDGRDKPGHDVLE